MLPGAGVFDVIFVPAKLARAVECNEIALGAFVGNVVAIGNRSRGFVEYRGFTVCIVGRASIVPFSIARIGYISPPKPISLKKGAAFDSSGSFI